MEFPQQGQGQAAAAISFTFKNFWARDRGSRGCFPSQGCAEACCWGLLAGLARCRILLSRHVLVLIETVSDGSRLGSWSLAEALSFLRLSETWFSLNPRSSPAKEQNRYKASIAKMRRHFFGPWQDPRPASGSRLEEHQRSSWPGRSRPGGIYRAAMATAKTEMPLAAVSGVVAADDGRCRK